MTATQRIIARVLALGSAYFAVSLLDRVAAAAEADAAAARLAAATADEALFAHLTGPCGCDIEEARRAVGLLPGADPTGVVDEILRQAVADRGGAGER